MASIGPLFDPNFSKIAFHYTFAGTAGSQNKIYTSGCEEFLERIKISFFCLKK